MPDDQPRTQQEVFDSIDYHCQLLHEMLAEILRRFREKADQDRAHPDPNSERP